MPTLTERDYQPSLVWAAFNAWASRQQGGDMNKALYIYLKDEPGAYYLHGPKLYLDSDLSDGHFQNCEQDALWTERERLGDVVAQLYRDTLLVADNLPDALAAFRKPQKP